MKNIQNKQGTLTQKTRGREIAETSIQEDVTALIRRFHTRANKIGKKRHTLDDRAYWRTRGRQQILWRISTHLLTMQKEYASPYMLYLALKEFLDYCLDKYAIDANDEQHTAYLGNGLSTQHWEAAGEAQELPAIRKALSGLIKIHSPRFVRHVLSLDGKDLVSLQKESNSDTVCPPEQVLHWHQALIPLTR